MPSKFDLYGWYAGEGEGARTTPLAPANTSQTTTPGELRANFTGFEWQDQPYRAPAVDPAPETPVPASITMRQARLALLGAGMLAGVSAAIDALPEPQKSAAQIEWEYSNEVQRHNGFVEQLAPALGLTTAQLDALFIAAAKL